MNQVSQKDAIHLYDNDFYWDKKLSKIVRVYIWAGCSMGTTEDPSFRFFATVRMKDL